jgi:hypothetical protein
MAMRRERSGCTPAAARLFAWCEHWFPPMDNPPASFLVHPVWPVSVNGVLTPDA